MAPVALAAAAMVTLGGCAKIDASLGQTWVDVTFRQTATLSTIQHVRLACSHVPNVHPDPLPRPHTVLNLMAGVRYDTTKATDANVAELQECLQKYPSVQGVTPGDTGDEGG